MAIGTGMSCVKYLLFLFNLLFAITGIIIIVVSARASPYIDLADSSFYTSAPVVLIVVGVIIFIIAFFGCCGAIKENHCMVITFSVLLLAVFLAELAVGIAGYMNHGNLEDSVMKYFNSTMTQYNNNTDVKRTYDVMQLDFQCCGIHGPKDWLDNQMEIPDSCCGAQEIQDGHVMKCDMNSTMLHTKGCLDFIVEHYKEVAIVLGGLGIGIAFVQLLGVIFACCLARSIRQQYETV